MCLFRIYTAIITPFDRDANVDEKGLRKLVDFQIDSGITGLLVVMRMDSIIASAIRMGHGALLITRIEQ